MKRRLLVLVPAVVLAASLAASALAATGFASPAFQSQWQTDEALIPNFWGPLSLASPGLYEPYREAVGGVRLVQYFDKGRMEITNSVLTNGLLATELTTGQMQLGDATFQFQPPPEIPVAGDPDNLGPTYAGLFRSGGVLFEPATPLVGTPVTTVVAPTGAPVGTGPSLGPPGTISTYDTATRHNVAAAFVDFRNRAGLQTIGWARSEPFQSTVRVGGVERRVMVQVFERRVLTFTPENPAAFQVEMGNIGQHYYRWRYSQLAPPTPTPTAAPNPAPRYTFGPERTNLTQTSATFDWRTDQPTTSRVEYDTQRDRVDYRFAAGSTTDFRTTHSVTLTGLTPSTVYFVRFVGVNNRGQRVEPSITSSFQTLATPPTTATAITSPTSGQRVSSPLTVTGTEDGSAFEGNIVIRLRDRNTGATLASQPTTVQRPDIGQPGTFSVTLTFVQPTTDTPGIIEIVQPPVKETDTPQVRASVSVIIAQRENNAGNALNVRWEWTSTAETQPPSQGVVPNPQNYTLVFRPGGTLEIRADCNTGSGTYVADTFGNVTIRVGAMTMAACGPDSLNQRFLASLGEVTTYAVGSGTLTLYYGPNNNRMNFRNGGAA